MSTKKIAKIEAAVSIRLVTADYYMSNPICGLDISYSTYRGMEVKKVPVIRIFGSTSSGSKVCLHVHGVLPYLYIPYDGSVPPDKMGHQISMALDKAINVLQGQGFSKLHHVFKTSLVNGIPIYGYHRKEHQFFKIFFYSPITRKHSFDLFLNGAIMNKIFQPCEAHIPYILQFMIDFNLQGMNYIHLKSALARRAPVGVDNFSTSTAEPTSTCEMELDCSANDILNCLDVQGGIQMNPGLAALWQEEIDRRRMRNMDLDNLSPPVSQSRSNVAPTSSHLFYLNNIKKKLKENENTSLSFYEVNEQLETSLAIETPDDVRDQLSASTIDFHGKSQQQTPTSSQMEGDPELLDVLCELADDHDSTLIEKPFSDEDDTVDEDSILGTQRSKASQASISLTQRESNRDSSESDEDDRETLEMSQIFCLDDLSDLPAGSNAEKIDQSQGSDEEDCNSTLTQSWLPNLDGANDTSSEDEELLSRISGSSKGIRKYKPLVFRKSTPKMQPKRKLKISTTTAPSSSSLLVANPASSKNSSQEKPSSDALFNMGWLSPQPDPVPDSPPRPETPNKIESAQVVIRPLLDDMSIFNRSRKEKVTLNSGLVVLKSLQDEIKAYQTQSGRKLDLPVDLKRKRRTANTEKTSKKKQIISNRLNENEDELTMMEMKLTEFERAKRSTIKLEQERNIPTPISTDHNQKKLNLTMRIDGNKDEISKSLFDPMEEDEEDHSENRVAGAAPIINETERENLRTEHTITTSENDQTEDCPEPKKYSTQLSSDPPSYDSLKTWNMMTSEDSDSNLTFTNIKESQPDSIINSFKAGERYVPVTNAPSRERVLSTMEQYGIPSSSGGHPYWGNPKDQVKLKDVRGKSLVIDSKLVRSLPEFKSSISTKMNSSEMIGQSSPVILSPLDEAPSTKSVCQWLEKRQIEETLSQSKHSKPKDRSQLEAPSMNNSYGFRVSFGNCLEAKSVHQYQYLTVMSMELHISTRQHLHPDPEFDAIEAVFFTLTNDVPVDSSIPEVLTAVIVVEDASARGSLFSRTGVADVAVTSVENEAALFREVFKFIRQWDPDILLGYEIEMLSWGFLLQRGASLGLAMNNLLSRVPSVIERVHNPEDHIEGGYMVEKNSDIAILGRIVLNLWRLLRVEIAVQSYTFENMVFHILHRRVQHFSFEKLTVWWKSNHDRWQVIEHYITRVRGNMQLLEQLDMIGRTSELARLFGIQFYEVFTRGSQFRVESMMLRLAKPNNFVAVSPSVMQRSQMKAPEWLPLIFEPESKFYTDPVIVLDFQSLYPSMIIAYNYCYSTCLGRAHHLGRNEPFEFGCTQLLIPPDVIQELVDKDLVNISPAGAVFVKPEIRTGILPQMLSEILNTRIMVKQSMKEYKGDNTLRKVFESRQLGLKLIANVTYGYTSANFSGRMPCVELGDSVVSKGRETLERTIHMIEERSEWNARVVYGDTDSVFILLPGRTKQEAFAVGAEIAEAVTQTNPPPVKLKFEKVYHPCILQTKKRYVGYKYETIDQKDPVYEAKGIETVRRDGCPAVVKVLERSLRVLFETKDVSQVKAYVQRQFSKILQNRISIQDFIFAKEYRGRQGYKPGACVPALEIAKNQLKNDRRSEARIGERVPYIVVYGSPGVPLIRLVIPARQLLHDSSLRLNTHYYISRVIIPPLQRCLGLLGVDVLSWYQGLPRMSTGMTSNPESYYRKATISQYFSSSTCPLCDEPIAYQGLCTTCASNRQTTAFSLSSMVRLKEKDYLELVTLCQSCTGATRLEQNCISLDCPVLYRRVKTFNQLQVVSKLNETLLVL